MVFLLFEVLRLVDTHIPTFWLLLQGLIEGYPGWEHMAGGGVGLYKSCMQGSVLSKRVVESYTMLHFTGIASNKVCDCSNFGSHLIFSTKVPPTSDLRTIEVGSLLQEL